MASTACADTNDFQTDGGGRLQLKPNTAQNAVETFVQTLTGAANVYANVAPFDPVPITVSGKYLVAWEAHGNAFITLAGAGTPVVATVLAGLGLNGALVGGTETMLARLDQKAPTTAQPPLEVHGTGAGTRVMDLVAGDLLGLQGARSSDAGTTSEIISSNQGRCRITAVRIGPS